MKKIYLFISITLCSLVAWAQPSNDDACDALTLTVDGGSLIVNSDNATVEADEPSPGGGSCFNNWCDGAAAQNSMWFKFDAPSNGAVNITTCLAGNTVDTQLALYSADDCGDFSSYNLAGANDDMPGDCSDGAQYSSTLSIDGLESGATYYIQVDGFDTASGEVEILVAAGIPQSGVRFLHNSADEALDVVDIWINGELVLDDLSFPNTSGLIALPADENLNFVITDFDAADDSNPLYSAMLNLNSSSDYLLMFAGILSDSGYDPELPLGHVLFDLSNSAPAPGMWNILLAHGVTDAPVVDVQLLDGGATVIDNVGFLQFGLSADVSPANISVQVTDEDGNSLGLTYCLPLYLFGNGGTLIVVATGFLDPTSNSDGAPLTIYVANPFGGNLFELESGECEIPVNDDICNSTELIVNGPAVAFDNTFATAQVGEITPPNLPLNDPEVDCTNQWCDGSNVTNTLWFYFVAPATGAVAVSTCLPITFDTQAAVWSVGDCNDFGTLTLMAQNDDADGGCGAGDTYASAFFATGLAPGSTYHIQVDGWGGSVGTFEIEIFSIVGINENDLNAIEVYPNPVNNELTINVTQNGSLNYSVTDMTGKIVESGVLNGSRILDCQNLAPGVYYLQTSIADQKFATRFVKQ